MSKGKRTNLGKQKEGVNPQGYGEETSISPNPMSQLEDRAKKSNTKR